MFSTIDSGAVCRIASVPGPRGGGSGWGIALFSDGGFFGE